MSVSTINEAPEAAGAATKVKPARKSGGWQRVAIYAVLILAAIFFLTPFIAMVFTSLKTMPEITGAPGFENNTIFSPPREISFEAWGLAWSSACIAIACEGLRIYFWNSIVMVIFAVAISVGLGAINGYVLAQWRFKGDNIVFGLLLFGCFIPFQIVLIPMARLLGLLDIAGTLPGLIFVHVCYGIPFTTLFFRNFYVTIPKELISAGRIDGAGFWAIFLLILVPVSWPIFVVSIIWQFTNVWNDFLFGASFAGADARPLMVALNNLVNTSTGTKLYNVDMAGAMIAALPTILVYVVGGRYFVRGLTSGAVKG